MKMHISAKQGPFTHSLSSLARRFRLASKIGLLFDSPVPEKGAVRGSLHPPQPRLLLVSLVSEG
jgi:hypothetical protein